MASQIGKKYVCKSCGSEFVVVKAGKSDLECCGKQMEKK